MAVVWLWCVVALLLLGLLTLWVLLYQLLRQQGRLLLRLEQLEEQLGFDSYAEAQAQLQGLEVGASVPSFQLPDLSGQPIRLDDYRGRRVLLVHWSLTCGFCEQIGPELAEVQAELRQHNTELVLISAGDAEANRRMAKQHGLAGPILLQPEASPVEVFQDLGTPVAYLVDEQGRVAAPLAVGARQVPRLAAEALDEHTHTGHQRLPGQRPLTHSRIKRDGLEPGSTAPDFTLPGVNGPEVSLADYRGRRVLLVFSDPDCGPCNELTPDLVRLHRQVRDDGLALVMVSRGAPEDNRRKCQEHRIEFPVGLQRGWQLSRQYGIFSTPVAFLINEQGVIADKVAVGAEAILALAKPGRPAGRRRL